MYRILIVDDERLIVEGMCRALGRLELFETECALSGVEALEILRSRKIDAMLLDINMPDMDGITLMRTLDAQGRRLPTVVISGYEEFEYVQEAMRYGAFDYLLKPLSPKNVAAIGLKLHERLERSMHEEEQNRQLRDFVIEQRGTIKQKLLSDILNGSVQPEQIEEMRRIYGIDLRGEYITAVVIHIRRASASLSELEFQMALRSAEQQIEHAFSDVPEANLFNMENARYVLLLSAAMSFDSALLSDLLQNTASALGDIDNIEAFIGKGMEVRGLGRVRESYNAANEALDYRSMFKNERIYDIGDYRENSDIFEIESMLDGIGEQLKHMRYDDAQGQIEALFQRLNAGATSLSEQQQIFFLYKCAMLLISVMLEKGLSCMGSFMQDLVLAGGKGWISPVQVQKNIQAMLAVIQEEIPRNYSEKNRGISQRVEEFIHEHFSDPGLSVRSLSDALNYSPNYLGNAFKREYGESINDYINKHRIRRAKEYMDRTDMRLYEIAFAVGFNDQHYFSKIFKKLTGLSPSEYRSGSGAR